jgi:hypothetical protein
MSQYDGDQYALLLQNDDSWQTLILGKRELLHIPPFRTTINLEAPLGVRHVSSSTRGQLNSLLQVSDGT